jgi:hypothetical protein
VAIGPGKFRREIAIVRDFKNIGTVFDIHIYAYTHKCFTLYEHVPYLKPTTTANPVKGKQWPSTIQRQAQNQCKSRTYKGKPSTKASPVPRQAQFQGKPSTKASPVPRQAQDQCKSSTKASPTPWKARYQGKPSTKAHPVQSQAQSLAEPNPGLNRSSARPSPDQSLSIFSV